MATDKKGTDETGAPEAPPTKTAESPSPLERILRQGRMVRDPDSPVQRDSARAMLGELVTQASSRDETPVSPELLVTSCIARIDAILSEQLDAILHTPAFQELESAWRGLHYLVEHSNTGTHLKIKVLNVAKEELRKDLNRAVDFDQSGLFKKVYEAEFGTFGGDPFGVLVGDYAFGPNTPDVAMLGKLSQVAAAAHAPFLAAPSPAMFDLDAFTELEVPRDLALQFESTAFAKWRSFRQTDDARYVALAMPRMLLRLPYGPDTNPVDELNYEERVRGPDHGRYLWGSAAYALAARITDAFDRHRWCAAIRGVEGGGLVPDLPLHTFTSANGDLVAKCPTEVAITDRREKELSDLGFLPLCHAKGSDYAAFFGGQTTAQIQLFDSDAANANVALSTQLPYILAASRFAHYLKAMMRDKVGTFLSLESVQAYLNGWIADYVLLNDNAGQRAKARHPLREARIDVREVPGRPGVYRAVAFLRPHFQLNELSVSIRLVAELPPPASA